MLKVIVRLAAAATVLQGAVAYAELTQTDGQVAVLATTVTTPHRGITMAQVEAQFGAPASKHEAVGQPPITRWDYPQFSVYFEHDRVLHAVVHGG